MAKLDMTMAIMIFEEEHGRLPGPTELPKLETLTLATPYIAGKESFQRAWAYYTTPPTPPEGVNWDEFSLMGCLDR